MTPDQRRQQIGRIHAAKAMLNLPEQEYRSLLSALTAGGATSCSAMSDRQLNHVLDWLNYLSGRRSRQPLSFAPGGDASHANLVRVCYAVRGIVPPGFERSPLTSMNWQERTCGRSAAFFEELGCEELWKLIEGLKAIFRRSGTRGTATLDNEPLSAGDSDGNSSPIPAGQRAAI